MRFERLVGSVILALVTAVAAAQGYPSRPVRIVAPFPAGGALDTIARTVAQPMGRSLGQNVIVENRAGGGGIIGAEAVARSPADGYTILMIGSVFTITPALRPKLPYDTLKDFAGIARLASNPMLVSVHPSLPVRTLKELIALARGRPGELTYATSGPASPTHIAMESFKTQSRTDILHVPYQGGAPATMAALGGHTTILVVNLSEAAPHATAGRLRPIALTSAERSDLVLKEVPTIAESGFPGFDMSIWFGAWVPAGTPAAIVGRLSAEIERTLRLPEVKENFARLGLSAAGLPSERFDPFFRAEVARYGAIVKEANIRAD